MNLPRSPFYEKELDIKISCSYGPGRYDSKYELEGIDYPPAYVRWTEKRNMSAFLDLISQGKINTLLLTTHRFDIKDAIRAYDIISGKTEDKYLGIILNYNTEIVEIKRKIILKDKHSQQSRVKIGFIGAGNFAQSVILPALKKTDAELIAVTSDNPSELVAIGNRLGFNYVSTDSNAVISDDNINAVVCTTPHEFHWKFVVGAIKAGKPIFVEKPLCVDNEQLIEIEKVMEGYNGRVMVGFNRRFSKSFKIMNEYLYERIEPLVMLYRVSAGRLSKDHWIYDERNKGRIIGEVCHFIDCMIYLANEMPQFISAISISGDNANIANDDNVIINIKFSKGSIGSILYTSQGAKSVDKEYFEAFSGAKSVKMHNFQKLELFDNERKKIINTDGDKGHNKEIELFISAVQKGEPMPINFDEIRAVTLTTFAIYNSLTKLTTINMEKFMSTI